MQYVRCDSCGAKAILAASRCPKCAVPLQLRDHHGVLVALARCRSCGTMFPASKGACKWCGPTRPARVGRFARIGGGVVVVAALVVLWRTMSWPFPGAGAAEPLDTGTGGVAEAPPATPRLANDRPVPQLPNTSSPASVSRPALPGDLPAAAPGFGGGTGDAAAAGPWTEMRATTWVNVRASASPEAPVVGLVDKDSTVQLGASVAGWRPVRAGALRGWVDRRHFEPVVR